MQGRIAAIILAAGYSSRMGDFKPLLPLGGKTVMERAVGLFRAAGIHDVRVVVGNRAGDLYPVLDRLGVPAVVNGRFAEGMFSSVVAGIAGLEPGVEAFFLLPVDIPLVRPRTVAALARAYDSGSGGIVYPVFGGRRGHPPLIAARYRDEILAWGGEGGLKPLLTRYDDDSMDLETGDEGILMDMDNPGDYDRLCRVAAEEGLAPAEEALP